MLKFPTATVITSVDQPVVVPFGTAVTYSATIVASSLSPAPTGFMSFLMDSVPVPACTGVPLGVTCTVSGGLVAVSLTAGVHTITANYSGDGTYAAGTGTYTQSVVKAPLAPINITVTATSSPAGPVYSQPVTLTATITGIASGLLSVGDSSVQGGWPIKDRLVNFPR
ncbi:MAG TPA: Ig-like domain-containing protein [Candidatus Sulfopaludibacter sp.]|nr:Ig-like domain-containing protein [Candidatus Sulfopaludibacter sp.]